MVYKLLHFGNQLMFTNKNVNMFLTESLDKGVEDSGIVEKNVLPSDL